MLNEIEQCKFQQLAHNMFEDNIVEMITRIGAFDYILKKENQCITIYKLPHSFKSHQKYLKSKTKKSRRIQYEKMQSHPASNTGAE